MHLSFWIVAATAATAPTDASGIRPTEDKYLETIRVADNIYVFKPKIDWTHGNGVAIIGPEGVFFVDTYIQSNYAEEAIRRLRAVTRLPVRYVLNTHWHYDHVVGNGTFREAFPESRLIVQDSTAVFLDHQVKTFLEQEPGTYRGAIDQLTNEVRDGKITGSGYPITGTMKPFWELMLREAQEYQRDYRPSPLIRPDMTFTDSLTMRWGGVTLHMIHMADNGHAEGDAVVWIPEKRVLIAGDLVVAPTPYATHWNSPGVLRGLLKIEAMHPAVIIPGHGPVEHDLGYLHLLIRAFGEYRHAAEAALASNVPLAQALDSIVIRDIDRQFTGDDDLKRWAYRAFFRRNLIYYTYKPPAPVVAGPSPTG